MKHIVAFLFSFLAQVALTTAAPAINTRQRSLHVDAHQGFNNSEAEGGPKLRTGFEEKKKKDKFKGKEDAIITHLNCGESRVVNSASSKDSKCPLECAYFVQDKTDDKHCSFMCVAAEQCAAMNPKTPIADKLESGQSVCRSPMVQFCKEYKYDGTDTCVKCNSAYYLHTDGTCHYKYMPLLYAVLVVMIAVMLFGGYWAYDLKTRPQLNQHGLEEALAFRSRSKVHAPRTEEGGSRALFPLKINLCYTQVAGPGLLLHFNFQIMVIIWAFLVGFGWILLGVTTDDALFVMGTRKFGTPRENCILVAWGYETQQRLMWTKILFLTCVYIGTFICTLLHGVRQLRMFQLMDMKTKTMKDFVAMIEGLPEVYGTSRPENDLKKLIEDATKCNVEGVTVCWEYGEQKELVDHILQHDIDADHRDSHVVGDETARAIEQFKEDMPFMRKKLYSLETQVFCEEEFDVAEAAPEKVKPMLEAMRSSDSAFVVFKTEKERDQACDMLENGLDYQGTTLTLKAIVNEPDTIQWENFGHSRRDQIIKLLKGFGMIFLALSLWTIVFYAPYAYSIMGFNYDNGQEPGMIYSIAFTMVVVIGNAIMYEVCAQVSDMIGLRFKDDREATYMILYTVACMFNVLLDFVTTYYMALMISSELGFRTYHGRKIKEIESFTKQFESYALQRMLAENAFSYAFPSTFLVPFVLEPFITIIAPLIMAEWVVRSHPEIVGHSADMLMMSFPMELGRYADILLNVVLGAIFFYFPGGATHILFLGMAVSHIWIYAFDHYKVLRAIPTCQFASMDVDWYSQAMCAPCTAIVLSCLAFKANCKGYGYCLDGYALIGFCSFAFIAHTIVHILCLQYLVPLLGKVLPEDHMENITYPDVARKIACSWFNSNPIHCLRSQFVYEDAPHCRFCFAGKEHLLLENEKISCYFKDEAAEVEDFGVHAKKTWGTVKATLQAQSALKRSARDASADDKA